MEKERNYKIYDKIAGAESLLTGLWAFLMLTVFPLYMEDRFFKIGNAKFRFFLWSGVWCLIPAGVLAALRLWAESKGEGEKKQEYSVLDRAMLLYLAAAALSFCVSVDRQRAWTGEEGWLMGLRTQLLLVLSYFLISRCVSRKRAIFTGHFLASGIVFLLGIGHRFGLDPLGMYEGIDETYQLLFLSTIGQASWYSSYVCTVLAIGVAAYFKEENRLRRILLGCYCLIGFSTVVTQNSDSAFVATAFMLLGLFCASCDSFDGIGRFLEIVLLVLGGFKLMGIFQVIFADRATGLDRISEFMSQSPVTGALLLAVAAVYAALWKYRQKRPDRLRPKCGGTIRRLAAGSAAAVPAAYAAAVWLNTTGRLSAWFGVQSADQYLLFDSSWGNSRGFIWSFAVRVIGDFPLFRKLFGTGPDCFAVYCYEKKPELSGELNRFFGWGQTLTNAHNEFLNTLFCLGIVGLAAFVLLLAAAVRRFFEGRNENVCVLAGMLAALSYGAHNFFCYQQICCTPFLFLILGMAERSMRQNRTDGASRKRKRRAT